MMRGSDRGFTVVDLAVAAGILGSLVLLAVPVILRVREDSHRARCKNNLKQLSVALLLYRDRMGRSVRYPEYLGANFWVKLYTVGLTQPADYLCPSTRDDNRQGALLKLGATPPAACSYSGPAIHQDMDEFPIHGRRDADEALGTDDDEGRMRFNHGDVIHVLYNGLFVRELPARDPAVAAGIGKAPLLRFMAN